MHEFNLFHAVLYWICLSKDIARAKNIPAVWIKQEVKCTQVTRRPDS